MAGPGGQASSHPSTRPTTGASGATPYRHTTHAAACMHASMRASYSAPLIAQQTVVLHAAASKKHHLSPYTEAATHTGLHV